MLALRWSSRRDLLLLALLGAVTLAAATGPRPHHRCHAYGGHRHSHVTVELRAMPSRTPARPPIQIDLVDPARACSESDYYYRHREFDRAAASLRRAVAADPGLEAHAQLYDQLARAWDRAMAPDATAVTRFEALRFARRLDLSLGGHYADELDAHLRQTAPLAAIAYARARNPEGLELALTTCDALGVPAEQTRAARGL